ncbi:hypothetical protein LTR70_006464 [Exophiala xenobiotica]|uniref:RFX-type winged-helix domain-containing protein n=1 Tax=Lithohypha guttulata TaxID=1690604 RepID=A0ABR0JYP4_9EURO|nr:hypothetical protein LTR24_009021 [Lithohypha guttulata]KAK5316009.1 hypothetical protein LTR70_006464 [Exophiala xenobiotica]
MTNTTNKHPPSRKNSLDRPPALSRSASAASSHGHLRTKSRGSSGSLQSVGIGNAFQPVQPTQVQHAPLDQSAYFVGDGGQQTQYPPPPNMDDTSIMAYQHNMQQIRPQQPHQMMPQHDMRPMTQHGYPNMQPIPVGYADSMTGYGMPTQHIHHMRHASEHYEGSPAPDDSNNENGPSKRRKGTASSLANDQELRRLLAQYNGRTLKEVANEVQKNEGSGGKSEKAKQVFAMLWLQDTCQRSSNSVRRDRVFARYTERCGNERVPTLNPASFGKLVRIIFPNVQTRRLGVRGESKYHYVDLSLVPDDNDPGFDTFDRPGTSSGPVPERPASSASTTRPLQLPTKQVSLNVLPPRMTMETADFPAPAPALAASGTRDQIRLRPGPTVHKLDCRYVNTPTIKVARGHLSAALLNALPSVRANMPGTLATYLSMPSKTTLCQPVPSSQESPIELPDIHLYLRDENYDHHIAKLLHDLYRSYCIDVIDAFRKCKDKSFFNHHSAFNGKMTVPVSKLFNLECLAPWIQECDMRMYRQILRYMTPLVLQDVPEAVWNAFDRISNRLVAFLINSFEEKCPPHVVAAKTIPAARFTNLLRKLRSAQTSTLQLNRMLEVPQTRTQMWLDMCSVIDPDLTLQECNPPPECFSAVQGMLKHDLRVLLGPEPDPLVDAAEQDPTSSFARMLQEQTQSEGVLSGEDNSTDLIVRLVSWLECLPDAFEGHNPQCLIDWQTRFFRSIMNQFGSGGAISYQSWWYFENFTHQMLAFMTELEGLLLPAEDQKTLDLREKEKSEEHTRLYGSTDNALDEKKRKRASTEAEDHQRAKSPKLSRPNTAEGDTEPEPDSAHTVSFPPPNAHDSITNPPLLTPTTELPPPPMPTQGTHEEEEDDDVDMAEISRGGPLDLPSFKTGFTSPIKAALAEDARRASGLHEDSGIGMGIDEHHDLDADALEAEKEAKKFNKRDWFLSSDPVEPGSGVSAAMVS